MEKLKVVYREVGSLIPYENNPRINDRAVDAVAASIKEFGFKVPILIDGDNVIVAGHTRLKAAKKLDLLAVPCIVVDDLTEEQARELRLADNKTGELAEWDFSKLQEELDALDAIDMSVFGFDDLDFDDEINTKTDSEFEEPDEQFTVCPSCGLRFVPEFE